MNFVPIFINFVATNKQNVQNKQPTGSSVPIAHQPKEKPITVTNEPKPTTSTTCCGASFSS